MGQPATTDGQKGAQVAVLWRLLTSGVTSVMGADPTALARVARVIAALDPGGEIARHTINEEAQP